jgi:hypothetical protein
MCRNRAQMDDAWSQQNRDRLPSKRTDQRPQSADAAWLAVGGEKRQTQIRLRQIAGGSERKAIARWPDDEIDRC